MGCGRGKYWDVVNGMIVTTHAGRKHYADIWSMIRHIIHRAEQGYPDAISALLEASEDGMLKEVLNDRWPV